MRPFISRLAEKPRGNQDSPRDCRGQHPGLLLQRYLYKPDSDSESNHEEKRALLDGAIRAAQDDLLTLWETYNTERENLGSLPLSQRSTIRSRLK